MYWRLLAKIIACSFCFVAIVALVCVIISLIGTIYGLFIHNDLYSMGFTITFALSAIGLIVSFTLATCFNDCTE